VADRIIVMRLGEKVFDGPRADVDGEDLIAIITGARLAEFRAQASADIQPEEQA
jgi:ABC-type sugar transport system ATPase subunit